jgi:hypothetical protein
MPLGDCRCPVNVRRCDRTVKPIRPTAMMTLVCSMCRAVFESEDSVGSKQKPTQGYRAAGEVNRPGHEEFRESR